LVGQLSGWETGAAVGCRGVYFPLLREKAGYFSVALRVMSTQPEERRRRFATDILVSAGSGMFFMRLAPGDSVMQSSAKKILRGANNQIRLLRSSSLCGGLI
jgi:hypothetical protein